MTTVEEELNQGASFDFSEFNQIWEPRVLNVQEVSQTGIKVIDFVTGLPRKIGDFGDQLNEDLIRIGQNVSAGGSRVATENLTENKIQGVTRKLGTWVNSNRGLAVGIAVLVVYLIFRR